jgi:hypothetical protein
VSDLFFSIGLLPEPARYFPVRPVYDVTPALRALGTDFGNGEADRCVFQIDEGFPRYRQSKLAARAERLEKYYRESRFSTAAARAITGLIMERLTEEQPAWFQREESREGPLLQCRLTGEVLAFTPEMDWDPGRSRVYAMPRYVTALDALACQVQEDLAVTLTGPENEDWLAAIHVCNPSGWAPEEKIGLRFTEVHGPVPGMERLAEAAAALVRTTVEKGPFVRFVWTLTATERLNTHPEPPDGVSAEVWRDPRYRPDADPPFYFRTERQVLWGLPGVGAALFTIRPALTHPAEIRDDPDRRDTLIAALQSMGPESLHYKGIAGSRGAIIDWLRG